MSNVLKRWFQSLWGVTYPEAELTPAIDCEACRIARSAGKDACNVHRTHHDHGHLADERRNVHPG